MRATSLTTDRSKPAKLRVPSVDSSGVSWGSFCIPAPTLGLHHHRFLKVGFAVARQVLHTVSEEDFRARTAACSDRFCMSSISTLFPHIQPPSPSVCYRSWAVTAAQSSKGKSRVNKYTASLLLHQLL